MRSISTMPLPCPSMYWIVMVENPLRIPLLLHSPQSPQLILTPIDFLKLVIIAMVIATPIAWYAMNRWLADYTYRISIGWGTFIIAGLLAVVIAMLTVSFQAVKAATANPVKNLRSE